MRRLFDLLEYTLVLFLVQVGARLVCVCLQGVERQFRESTLTWSPVGLLLVSVIGNGSFIATTRS